MPMLELTCPAGAVAADRLDALAEALADALLRWEGAPDSALVRAITWVYVHELPGGALRVGRRRGGEPRFRVDVTVPAGTFSPRRKAGLMAEVDELVRDAAGLGPDDGLRVWTLFRDVPEGDWGAAGEPVTLERLRATVGGA